MVVYINNRKANKQKHKADQKKYNLSHFLLTDHSLIHLLKYLFNIYHMPGPVLRAGRYILVNKIGMALEITKFMIYLRKQK